MHATLTESKCVHAIIVHKVLHLTSRVGAAQGCKGHLDVVAGT